MVALLHMVGTCNLGYLYNLGGQHGARRLKIDGFANELNRLISPGRFSWFICTTNGSQEHERKMLDALGFKYSNAGRMRSHTISFAEFRKNYKEGKWSEKAKEAVEKRKLAKIEAMKNRPRDENGRLLRKDGKIIRKPYELFAGDVLSLPFYAVREEHRIGYRNVTARVLVDHIGRGAIQTDKGFVDYYHGLAGNRTLSVK
jgi:hypothetical protein